MSVYEQDNSKNLWTGFDEVFRICLKKVKEEMIQFWE